MVLSVVAYYPALQSDYIWEDDYMVTDNPHLEDVDGLKRLWFEIGARYQFYPLVYTSYWLEHKVWGFDATGYHVVNLIFHILNAFLVWCLIRGLGLPGGWFVAALFALHPVQVTSVAWITERKNVLTGFFGLLAAIQFLKGFGIFGAKGSVEYPRRARVYFVAGYILFVLSLLSKTSTCILPAVLLIILWWKNQLNKRALGWLIGLFVISAGSAVLTIYMELHHIKAVGTAWDYSLLERAQIAARSLCGYVINQTWPPNIKFFYPRWNVSEHELILYGPVVVWVGVLAAGIFYTWRTKQRGLLAGVLMYGIVLSPVLGFINVYCMQYSFIMDHWQYLAAIIFFALATAGLIRGAAFLRISPRVLGVLGMGFLLWLTCLTFRWTGYFENEHVLWKRTLEQNPTAWLAHNNLGTWESKNGNVPAGKAHFMATLELNPDYELAQYNLGAILFREGELTQARHWLNKAVERDPQLLGAHEVLSFIELKEGRKEAARKFISQAVELGSENPDLLYHYVALVRPEGSAGYLHQALNKKPGMKKAKYLLAQEYHRTKQLSKAVSVLRELVQEYPFEPQYCNDLAWFKAQDGSDFFNAAESVALAEKACRLTHFENVNFLDTLATAYAAAGDLDNARERLQKALSLAAKAQNTPQVRKLQQRLLAIKK